MMAAWLTAWAAAAIAAAEKCMGGGGGGGPRTAAAEAAAMTAAGLAVGCSVAKAEGAGIRGGGGGAAWVAESPLKVLAISADDVGIPVPKGGG